MYWILLLNLVLNVAVSSRSPFSIHIPWTRPIVSNIGEKVGRQLLSWAISNFCTSSSAKCQRTFESTNIFGLFRMFANKSVLIFVYLCFFFENVPLSYQYFTTFDGIEPSNTVIYEIEFFSETVKIGRYLQHLRKLLRSNGK